MKITRLRLLGFKSFVEPTELLIETGLTGVVGPNGCGKSNLLEALRWVMGETSYKSLRGSAMDDVIFAGTQNRPARNMAEVTIALDNGERLAPAEFNDSEHLEVTRRIEREAGSAYRINGKDVRARDVRLLFEDAATGAHSPALVRQGRIGEIVNAKPQERRRILEDAAGIAGLHSRRHEAELRLKATDANLERLQDILAQLTTQHRSLKRQARQARAYKELSGKMAEAEALQLHMNWTAACAQVTASEGALRDALQEVARLTRDESEALKAQTEAADALTPLREDEAVRAAALHRLNVERETLEAEEARAKARRAELESRREQLETDIARERGQVQEAGEVLARIEAEETELAAMDDQDHGEEAARTALEAATDTLGTAETGLSDMTAAHAEANAKRRQLKATIADSHARTESLTSKKSALDGELEALNATVSATGDIVQLLQEVERLSDEAGRAEAEALAAEDAQSQARAAETTRRDALSEAKLRAQELETEAQTLTKLLMPAEDARWTPIIDDMRVEPGYELALGAALGEDLQAPADAAAPVHWVGAAETHASADLPEGATPLARFVSAPSVLAPRLAQTGLVARADGPALQRRLRQGQRLVSKEGDLWRWDGYAAAADAPTATAKRLAERNRLSDLKAALERARGEVETAAIAHTEAATAARDAEQTEQQARTSWREAQATLGQARDTLAEAERAAQESSKQLGALVEAKARTEDALAEAERTRHDAQEALEGLEAADALEAALAAQRTQVEEARAAYADARATLDGLERERRTRAERRDANVAERERWSKRLDSAEQQIEALGARLEETQGELQASTDLPEQIAERGRRLLDEISEAETARSAAADALAAAETLLQGCDTALRQAQNALSEAKEERGRSEARLEAARERRAEQVWAIREKLDCAPEDCLARAGLAADAELPEAEEIEARIAKLNAERERLGAVNLRAEEEAEQIAQELEALEREQEDLQQAITRLRQGIASLNQEGRKRLLEAFDTVNTHFQRLFQTLFAGGQAELQLVESDDPLESGLEILARPPGKKPQVLTLLSGGEKALTALALIFAVFLTNPSPICVLDEVDAPLDDANVERFCNLMDDMARSTETRFLIITHHPMTMARVDRLFGVTMSERGVSQLVSVDLEAAERYRDSA